MQRLLLLGPREIQSGVYPGVGKAAVPLWESGETVAFREFGLKRIDGGTAVGSALANTWDLAQAFVAGERRVYRGSTTSIRLDKLAAGVWTQSTLYTWPTATPYADLETWGTWL